MRLVLALVLVALAACGRTTTEYASVPGDTITTVPYEGRLRCDVEVAGAPLRPPAADATRVWTRDDVARVVGATDFFRQFRDEGKRFDVHLASYSGTIPNPLTAENHLTEPTTLTDRLVWIVVVDDLLLQPRSMPMHLAGQPRPTEPPSPGFMAGVFLDGVDPAQSVSGIEEAGDPAPPNC